MIKSTELGQDPITLYTRMLIVNIHK